MIPLSPRTSDPAVIEHRLLDLRQQGRLLAAQAKGKSVSQPGAGGIQGYSVFQGRQPVFGYTS